MEPKKIKLDIAITGKDGKPLKDGEDPVTVRTCLQTLLTQGLPVEGAKESIIIQQLVLQISDDSVSEIDVAKKRWDILEKHAKANKDVRGSAILVSFVQGQVLLALGFTEDDL